MPKHRKTIALFALGSIALLAPWVAGIPAQAQKQVPPSRAAVQYSFAPIVRRAAPAVVNVYVRRRVRAFASPFANDPFFRQFFGDQFGRPSERIQSSLGSGVIVTPDGIVVTNTHVIKGRGDTEIRIALADKREFDAKVLTQDDKTDIAILKIENGETQFPTLELEDSDTLEVGDLVLAIGNPFGVGQTVTSGIVSALARSEVGRSTSSQVFIQTDAAINPGNSGGALVDMAGKVVGINTMIFSKSGGSHGIGFAIPSNLVRLYVDAAVQGQKVERPWLGARLEQVTREVAEGLGLDRIAGAMIARISDGGPAALAGLRAGDVITHVDDVPVSDTRAVHYRLTTRGIGKTVRLTIVRNQEPQVISLKLRAAPAPGRDDVRNLAGEHPLDGARVANMIPGVADTLGIDDVEGVAILSVRPRSVAKRLGFRTGDILIEVGRQPIESIAALEKAIAKRRRVWVMKVRRGNKVLNLRVPG
jgi:Do/DeqQ family serine protease